MDHRALHGRENALLLLVVLIHGCPSAFANSKASEFRRDIECEETVAQSNFEGRAGLPQIQRLGSPSHWRSVEGQASDRVEACMDRLREDRRTADQELASSPSVHPREH
jgi:hypothetical protein